MLLFSSQFLYQVIDNISVTHKMQTQFFVMQHFANIRVVE